MLTATSGGGTATGGDSAMNGASRTPAASCVPTAMPRAGASLAQRFM